MLHYSVAVVKNPHTKKYEARARVQSQTITIEQAAAAISARSTISRADIEAVMVAFLEFGKEQLKDGNRVSLGKLGTLFPTLKSDASDSSKNYSAALIRGLAIHFAPSLELKRDVQAFKATRVASRATLSEAGQQAAELAEAKLTASTPDTPDTPEQEG